jgi:hypothetical protein
MVLLRSLYAGIKKYRGRLQQVENEFVKIKQEFADDLPDGDVSEGLQNHQASKFTANHNGEIEPKDIPF